MAHYTNVLHFVSLRHNMAIKIVCKIVFIDKIGCIIIKAQWSEAVVLWTTDPEFESAEDFCNKLLK